MPVPTEALISKDHAEEIRSEIMIGKAMPAAAIRAHPLESSETTHFSIVDRWGNVVSYTSTIEYTWGSGITVPGYGFVLHDRANLFSLDPDSPNIVGNVDTRRSTGDPATVSSIRPSCGRRRSAMSRFAITLIRLVIAHARWRGGGIIS